MSPLLHVSAVTVCAIVGCAPAWHAGDRTLALSHSLQRAVVYEDRLSVQGVIQPLVSVTDYGFRVNEVHDGTGKNLSLKSFQIFWMKELRFEAEFEAPSVSADTVLVDVEFLSRSGRQRLRSTLPIERNATFDYRTQLPRWQQARMISRD